MTALLPMIAELDEARDGRAIARWLLCCPHSILISHELDIRDRLKARHFPAAIAYFEAELATLFAVRKAGLSTRDNPCLPAMLEAARHHPEGA